MYYNYFAKIETHGEKYASLLYVAYYTIMQIEAVMCTIDFWQKFSEEVQT